MTTATLYETIQRIVQAELKRQQTAELATVQESHPHASKSDMDNYACTVVMRNTGLVLTQVPVATAKVGHVSVPLPGELVLVQFIGGDLNAPVITGSFYTDKARPPVNTEQQTLWQLPAEAEKDKAVRLQLSGKAPCEIRMQVGGSCSLTLIDDDPVVTVKVGDAATVQIDRDGAVNVTSQGAMKLEANTIEMKAQTDFKLEAGANMTIKGALVNIN